MFGRKKKKDEAVPSASDDTPAEAKPEKKKGWFSRLKDGLSKSKDKITDGIDAVIGAGAEEPEPELASAPVAEGAVVQKAEAEAKPPAEVAPVRAPEPPPAPEPTLPPKPKPAAKSAPPPPEPAVAEAAAPAKAEPVATETAPAKPQAKPKAKPQPSAKKAAAKAAPLPPEAPAPAKIEAAKVEAKEPEPVENAPAPEPGEIEPAAVEPVEPEPVAARGPTPPQAETSALEKEAQAAAAEEPELPAPEPTAPEPTEPEPPAQEPATPEPVAAVTAGPGSSAPETAAPEIAEPEAPESAPPAEKTEARKKRPGLAERIVRFVRRRKLDDDALESIEEVLIMADLGPAAAAKLTANLARDKFDKAVSSEEVREALAEDVAGILAPVAVPLTLDPDKRPHVVLVVGVNGSGKTTTIGKLGKQWSEDGLTVSFAAGDTFRAAAVEQLKIWGERANASVVARDTGADAAGLAYDAVEGATERGDDVLLIDTAGRLQNKADLMAELEKIVRVIRKLDETAPHSVLLVLDATVGQNAHSQVQIFKEIAEVSGLIVTKLDGSAKGGVIVALAESFGLPIHAIGVGEGADDMRPFEPRDFARSLMGLEG